jgi:hypothetical protein
MHCHVPAERNLEALLTLLRVHIIESVMKVLLALTTMRSPAWTR